MNISPIYNSADLRAEILRLENLEREKGAVIKQRLSSPGAVIATVVSLFKGDKADKGNNIGLFKQDFIGLISRFVLPLALNKTLFKNSNFIVKALVGLVSQKASTFISEESVTSVWDKAKGLVGKIFHKDKKPSSSYRKITKDIIDRPQSPSVL